MDEREGMRKCGDAISLQSREPPQLLLPQQSHSHKKEKKKHLFRQVLKHILYAMPRVNF